MIFITSEQQREVDRLRLELAQAIVDLAEIKTADLQSSQAQQRAIEGLMSVKRALDFLGLKHSSAKKPEGIAFLIRVLVEGEAQAREESLACETV